MAKRPRNIAANEREELVFDSEEQFASDGSDNDFAHDLSEDSDGIVGADEKWHDRRGEDRATVHHFTGPDPGLTRVVAHDINGASSSFDFFKLMFTEELFNSALLRQRRTATIRSALKKRR
jgi:hypothetical protein